MSPKDIAERLHELERKVLLALKKKDKQLSAELVKSTGLDEASVNRALLWLRSKGLIKLKEDIKELVVLDDNGELYAEKGFPEKRFLKIALEDNSIQGVKASLTKDEFNVSIGLLKSKGYIKLEDGKITVTPKGLKFLKTQTPYERLVCELLNSPLELSKLSAEQKKAVDELKSRKKIIKIEIKTYRIASLTNKGTEILPYVKLEKLIGQLTPQILSTGSYKGAKFRKYDLKAPTPRIFYGKKHFVTVIKDKIRRIFLDMGFRQVDGPLLELSFWNFDALFQPQDHPAREMHDTFFVKEPLRGRLPDKKLVQRVKLVHENGWTTGSKGWGYDWSESIASTNVLRTHTTAVSVRTLAGTKPKDLPLKVFCVGSVFRNETLDYKHLFEFTQVEGIVAAPNVTFRNLLGILKNFFNRLGFSEVRFRPGYFPYTEMSVEPEVLHPVKKEWMELGGAGIFRPEVVKPLLGIDVPVLAWGIGFERSVMDVLDIKDIRDVYSNNIELLREKSPYTRRF